MKLSILFLLSMVITAKLVIAAEVSSETQSVAKKDGKRKVAQMVQCVPLGSPFVIEEGDDYTADEVKMLRNSIYAQYGFKFQSSNVTQEMSKRGCLRTDVIFDESKIAKIDKKNISLLKSYERSIRENDQMTNFSDNWQKALTSAKERTDLLMNQYCYLTDKKDKYLGIVFFSGNKLNSNYELDGMMNIDKPAWAEKLTEEEKNMYANSVAYKTLDTTSAAILDFATKGSWSIAMNKTNSEAVAQITIAATKRSIKNTLITITAKKYKQARMLDCQLAD